jgi:hypothetical protein
MIRHRRRSPLLPTAQTLGRRRGAAGSARAPCAPASDNDAMIFDQPPAELPVATLRPHDAGAQLLLDVRGWLASRWQWLKPRAIPVAVAFAGMLAVLASAHYLRELAHQAPERLPAPVVTTLHADDPTVRLAVESYASGTGTPKIKPGACRRRIEPFVEPALAAAP